MNLSQQTSREEPERTAWRVQAGDHQAPHVLSFELDVPCEVAEWVDRQRAVCGRLMDVVGKHPK